MKRILSLVFAALLIFGSFSFFPFAEAGADSFSLSSVYEPYCILVNADSPSKSYRGIERDADKQVFPASTTKILTCLVALENGNLNDMVTVSANAVNFGRGNSLMGLQEGDQYTLRDLLYGMMLPSGNDAAIAIAEHIAGSTEAYAEKMNQKAADIGMTHSHFVTVHGKQNENHYTTVRDMAILTAYALNGKNNAHKDEFRKIVGAATYTAKSGPREIYLVNSNRLLIDTPPTEDLPSPISCKYEYAIGVKTGDTAKAGKCLIAAAEKDGVTLIAVLYGGTLDDPDYNDGWAEGRKDKYNARRFQDAAAMFDYAFSDMVKSYTVSELAANGMPVTFDVQISNASAEDSQGGTLTANADLSMDTPVSVMQPNPDAKITDLKIEAVPNFTNIYAPIGEGSVIGTVEYKCNERTLMRVNLLASRSVKEGTAQTEIAPAPGNSTSTSHGSLIGDANVAAVNPTDGTPIEEETGGCGLPKNMQWIPIVLIIVFVMLLICVALFILYLRAEAKRRRAAARRRARQRARQAGQDYTRR